MVKYLLKKSYNRKDLKEKDFKDLWNAHGVFTTMWIYGKPQKILFFKEHITNLIKSTKTYKIYDKNLKANIFKVIKSNLNKQKKYNHLLRIAVTKNVISISLRDKLKTKKNLELKLVNYNRINPEHKNLKYKFILKNLSKVDNTKTDIALCSKGKILETGTSNIIFINLLRSSGLFFNLISSLAPSRLVIGELIFLDMLLINPFINMSLKTLLD